MLEWDGSWSLRWGEDGLSLLDLFLVCLECLWPYLLPVLVVCQGTLYVLMDHLRLHLITVEEVDVRFVLLRILTHKQEDGGIAHLIEHCLAVLHCWQGKVLQLLLQEKGKGVRQWGTTELRGNGAVQELLGSLG